MHRVMQELDLINLAERENQMHTTVNEEEQRIYLDKTLLIPERCGFKKK